MDFKIVSRHIFNFYIVVFSLTALSMLFVGTVISSVIFPNLLPYILIGMIFVYPYVKRHLK